VQVDLKQPAPRTLGRGRRRGWTEGRTGLQRPVHDLGTVPHHSGDWAKIAGIPQGGGTKHTNEGSSHYGRFAYDGGPARALERPQRHLDARLLVLGLERPVSSACRSLISRRGKSTQSRPTITTGFRDGPAFLLPELLEEIDQPGEWYLDRKIGILYFWPPCDTEKAENCFP